MGSYSCCTSTPRELTKVESLSKLLKLVSEENRLKILSVLKEGEHCVCEIIKHLNHSQSLISHHLKDLKEAEIIASQKKGLWMHYSLTDKGQKLVKLLFSI